MSKKHTNRQGLKAAAANANDLIEPHIKLGDSLDESTKHAIRQILTFVRSDIEDPEYDGDKWHMRIVVVLLAAALEGLDVDVLVEVTGYPRAFIEHVWKRAEQMGLTLNPLNWTNDDARQLWIDTLVIEGKCKVKRYSDGTFDLLDVPNVDEFVPHDFVAAFQTGH